jgi:HSP20 family protein
MSMLAHGAQSPFGEVVEWLEAPWAVLRPSASHPIRVEDYVQDGSYIIRAEIPGVDPEKDIDVTVTNGILTIRAERREDEITKHHSEFRYGTFRRSLTLPAGADEDRISAWYGHGVLEVTVQLSDRGAPMSGRKIPVRQDHHIDPT